MGLLGCYTMLHRECVLPYKQVKLNLQYDNYLLLFQFLPNLKAFVSTACVHNHNPMRLVNRPVWLRFLDKYFSKAKAKAKVKVENCFAFQYNCTSTFYQNRKLLNYLDMINIEVVFSVKLYNLVDRK